jgi:hypothetical protein
VAGKEAGKEEQKQTYNMSENCCGFCEKNVKDSSQCMCEGWYSNSLFAPILTPLPRSSPEAPMR